MECNRTLLSNEKHELLIHGTRMNTKNMLSEGHERAHTTGIVQSSRTGKANLWWNKSDQWLSLRGSSWGRDGLKKHSENLLVG